jgi:D-glycero-beta-D-manno-heptose-7-phosphate kinase
VSARPDPTLAALLDRLADRQLLILGDVMLDETLAGEVRRVSPEAPVPVVELRQHTALPGGAANAAANAIALGARVALGGVVGQDDAAGRLAAMLMDLGVDTAGFVTERERPTTQKTRVVAGQQQIVRLDREERREIAPGTEAALVDWIMRRVPRADACVISDYGKGVVTPRVAAALVEAARTAGTPVVVDPKGRDYARYRGATVVTPNLREAEDVAGIEVVDDESLGRAAGCLRELLPGSAILITRGRDGMTLFEPGAPPLHVRSQAAAVFDVTGAGDTVIATLALALAAGASLPDATTLANQAAGIAVGKPGTATITIGELRP